ncbi:MAG: hypothetical protein ABIS50_06870 [Luteolibacter sp.]|uniref:hypothetical protein n=1 Tax=Luteolibacter sp. TaxID=1962973 RepID=UPI00326697B2
MNWISYMRRIQQDRRMVPDFLKAQFPTKSVAAFAISILACISIAVTSQSMTRNSVELVLANLNDTFRIRIDGRQVEEAGEIIAGLKSLSSVQAHHSHPTHKFLVEATDGEVDLKLILGRDSSHPDEYWVFVPDHFITSNNEIGRIVSSAFDSY